MKFGSLLPLFLLSSAGPKAAPPYKTVVAEDWRTFPSDSVLLARQLLNWGASGKVGPIGDYVHLVPDRTFGQVVRITQPQDFQQGYSPQLHQLLQAPLDKAWLRFRIRFSPGWTARGSGGASQGSAYKVMHLYMPGGGATGRTKIDINGGTRFDFGFSFPGRKYVETLLPGNTWGRAGGSSITTEFTDGEWYEFIVYHEKTGATTGRTRAWRRRLTQNGVIVDNPFVFVGWSYVGVTTADSFPQVSSLKLGINKNRSNDQTQSIFWGPWEVVDGSLYPNPWEVGP